MLKLCCNLLHYNVWNFQSEPFEMVQVQKLSFLELSSFISNSSHQIQEIMPIFIQNVQGKRSEKISQYYFLELFLHSFLILSIENRLIFCQLINLLLRCEKMKISSILKNLHLNDLAFHNNMLMLVYKYHQHDYSKTKNQIFFQIYQ